MAQSASSGIRLNVSEDAVTKYTDLRMKRSYRYLIYKIEEQDQGIVVEKAGSPDEDYETFTASLPENDCRFVTYDLDYTSEDLRPVSKIVFIAWSPETSSVKSKMTYASSRELFKHQLEGIHCEVQATDPTEVEIEALKDRVS